MASVGGLYPHRLLVQMEIYGLTPPLLHRVPESLHGPLPGEVRESFLGGVLWSGLALEPVSFFLMVILQTDAKTIW